MPDPADLSLHARLAEALRTAPSALMDTEEERARHAESERNHHVGHNYYYMCAVCRGEVDTLASAAEGVVLAELDRLTRERDAHRSGREQLRAVSREHRAERDRVVAELAAVRRVLAEFAPLIPTGLREALDEAGAATGVATSAATPNELPGPVGTWHTLGDCPDQQSCPFHLMSGVELETPWKDERPRCPRCNMPHDLDGWPAEVCRRIGAYGSISPERPDPGEPAEES